MEAGCPASSSCQGPSLPRVARALYVTECNRTASSHLATGVPASLSAAPARRHACRPRPGCVSQCDCCTKACAMTFPLCLLGNGIGPLSFRARSGTSQAEGDSIPTAQTECPQALSYSLFKMLHHQGHGSAPPSEAAPLAFTHETQLYKPTNDGPQVHLCSHLFCMFLFTHLTLLQRNLTQLAMISLVSKSK